MKSLAEIKAILREAYPELNEKYALTRVAIFGSYARGEQTTESDIDVLVSTANKNFNVIDLIHMREDFNIFLKQKTDVVIDEDIRAEFRESIFEDAIDL